MASPANIDVFRRVWDAYATGRLADILEHLDPEFEWHPSVVGADAVYRGQDGLARWAGAVRRTWKSLTVVLDSMREEPGDVVVALGRIVAFDHGGERRVDGPMAWVAEFRDARMVSARTFPDHGAAGAWVRARARAGTETT